MTASTDFEKTMIRKLHSVKEISDSSIKAYLSVLRGLNNRQELTSSKFLEDIDEIEEKIKHKKATTRRNAYIAIVSLLSTLVGKEDKKLHDKYYAMMKEANKNIRADMLTHKKSIQQSDNWITWQDVEEKWQELADKVDEFKDERHLNYDQYTILLQFMILSLYVLQPPRRNKDYYARVIKNPRYDPTDHNYSELNYVDLDNDEFIFNDYKTKRTQGTQKFDIPSSLMKVIKLYLKFHPHVTREELKRKNGVIDTQFLVNYDGSSLNSTNAITYILNKIFGRKIGSSMLRHSYLTAKYGEIEDERELDAQKMAHSVGMAVNYIKKD